ncbi:hypothetical protein BHE74_00011928 [Ensete ventricosum]|nr:hypothetical protein BHE74_00011928 [Ensete ventricosum]
MDPPSNAKMLVENLHACPIGALSWVEGALGFGSGGRRLMPGSLGREFAPAARVNRGFLQGAFIVGATGRSYLRSLLPLLLTMLSYFSTPFVVLVVRRVFCLLRLWRVNLTYVRSVVQSLTPPCPCQVDHAGGLVVQGRGDVAARSIFAISTFNF